jgi:hypothetical protein
MSTLSIVPPGSVGWRAALVLLVTLLAHAFLLARVDRMLAGAEAEPAKDAVAVSARLLPPPPAVAPAAPPPPLAKPRPAPAARKPAAMAAAAAAATAPPLAEPAAPPNVGADAFGAEPPAATEQAPAAGDASADAGMPPAAETAAGEAAAAPPPFEASGASLLAALANLPEPSAALPAAARYVYRTTNSELRLASGTSTVDWSLAADGQYRLRMTTTAVGMTVLELESQGRLRAFGLAPDRYVETRVRRGAVAANFDWEGRRVTFSARSHERALADGVQDRVSFQFQLMLLGQAQPEAFREGRSTVLLMAGRDDVSTYRFRSAGPATTTTGAGELKTVKIERIAADPFDARIEVWLAPSLGWLPARLRFTDRYGRVTESVLESMPTS